MPNLAKYKTVVTTTSLLDHFDTREEAIEWLLGDTARSQFRGFILRMVKALLEKYNGDVDKVRDHILKKQGVLAQLKSDDTLCAIIPTLMVVEKLPNGGTRTHSCGKIDAKRPFEEFKLMFAPSLKHVNAKQASMKLEDGAMKEYQEFLEKRRRVVKQN